MPHRCSRTPLPIAALTLALGAHAHAQTGGQTVESLRSARDRLLGQDREVATAVRAGQSYMFRSDFDESGSIAIARTTLGATLGWRAAEELLLGIDLAGEYSSYSFKDASGLGPGISDPLSDAGIVSITPSARWAIDDRWLATFAGLFAFSGELGADAGDSVTAGAVATVGYKFSDDLFLSLGVAASTRLEDNARVIPYLGLEWRVNEKLRLFTEGPGLALLASLDEAWAVKLTGRWDSREFRLDDEGENPDGVLRDESVSVGAELIWRPAPSVDLSIGGGAIVYQNYELLDDDGQRLDDDDADFAPFVQARLRLRF